MATLYEIDAAIMDCVDTETGEIIDEEKLNALLMERSAKLEGVALWIKNLDSDAAAIRAEREALEKRQKAAENKATSLRAWLANALSGQKFSTARVAISYRKSVSTEVDSECVAKKWCRKKITLRRLELLVFHQPLSFAWTIRRLLFFQYNSPPARLPVHTTLFRWRNTFSRHNCCPALVYY